jgi:peptidoglycan/LPS O-acetylase OafA/YrhL
MSAWCPTHFSRTRLRKHEIAMPSSGRVGSVEVLRGIAAVAVMWFHLTNGAPSLLPAASLVKQSGAYGWLGVQLFFVISGFVIPYSLSQAPYDIRRDGLWFLLRRMARIEPAYLASALLIVALQFASAFAVGAPAPRPDIARALALHVAYLAPWFDQPWLSPVFWSLAIEFQYYIAMLFLAPLLLSGERATIRLLLAGLAALSLASSDARAIFPYLPLFAVGFIRFLWARRVVSAAELVAWLALFLGLCCVTRNGAEAAAAGFAFAFLFLPLKADIPLLGLLGAISYSLYLIHVPIGGRLVNLATRLPPSEWLRGGAAVAAAAASLLAAYWFWRIIEHPSAVWSRSIRARADRPAPQGAALPVGR